MLVIPGSRFAEPLRAARNRIELMPNEPLLLADGPGGSTEIRRGF
jgi:hypothetical protein